MPYNYLFDEEVKNSSKIVIKDRIVIIDEGHNIPSVAKDSCSYMFSQIDLSILNRELKAISITTDEIKPHNIDEIKLLYFITQAFHQLIMD